MEVSILGPRSVRIKSKLATLVVNPVEIKSKVTAECVLLFEKGINEKSLNLESPASLVISGPGEYEVKGVKISGVGKVVPVAYTGRIESMDVCIARASNMVKAKDMLGEYNLVIIEEDVLIDQAVIAALNASVVLLYGEKAAEHVTSLGKDTAPVNKYAITRDKLPSEMEVVLLQ